MSKIGCVNYARFCKSGHIFVWNAKATGKLLIYVHLYNNYNVINFNTISRQLHLRMSMQILRPDNVPAHVSKVILHTGLVLCGIGFWQSVFFGTIIAVNVRYWYQHWYYCIVIIL